MLFSYKCYKHPHTIISRHPSPHSTGPETGACAARPHAETHTLQRRPPSTRPARPSRATSTTQGPNRRAAPRRRLSVEECRSCRRRLAGGYRPIARHGPRALVEGSDGGADLARGATRFRGRFSICDTETNHHEAITHGPMDLVAFFRGPVQAYPVEERAAMDAFLVRHAQVRAHPFLLPPPIGAHSKLLAHNVEFGSATTSPPPPHWSLSRRYFGC